MDRTDRVLNLDWSEAQCAGGGVYVLDSTRRTGTPSVAVRADRGGEQHVILLEKRALEVLARYGEMTLTRQEALQEPSRRRGWPCRPLTPTRIRTWASWRTSPTRVQGRAGWDSGRTSPKARGKNG